MKKSPLSLLLAVLLATGLMLSAFPPAALGDDVKIPFTANDTLDEVRLKIQQNNYQFTVKENWLTRLSPEERAAMFSRRASRQPRQGRSGQGIGPLAKYLNKPLPDAFDWRDHEGHSYVGPIRDQEDCNSCYAFAALSSAETAYNIAHGLVDGNTVDFSESFIVWCLGNMPEYNPHFGGTCALGADYDLMELEAVVKEGIITEPQYPYLGSSTPSCSSTHLEYPREKGFKNWYRITCGDIDAIKAAIRYIGAVDVAVESQVSAFIGYSGGIYEDSSTDCPSSPCYYTYTDHLVSLVGWDDNGGDGYWILRNSWGAGWGESGYMRIKYTSARVSCEASYLFYNPNAGPKSILQLLMLSQ